MDRWKYYAITHRDHVLCNPLGTAKLDELIALLELPRGARVLDIGSGKGELLVRLAERYGITGTGVDLSPYFVREARALAASRVPEADLTFIEEDGATFAGEPEGYLLASCLGASWTFGGHRGTVRALARWARPGGLVVAGEPFWRRQPDVEYLGASGMSAGAFATHAGNVQIGVEERLTPLFTLVSNDDEWDRYQGLQWQAADRYAVAHPDDPDVPALLERQRHSRDLYLRWERDILGWAIYLFRR